MTARIRDEMLYKEREYSIVRMEEVVLGVRADHDINTQMFSAVRVIGSHRLYTTADGELRLKRICIGLMVDDRDATDRRLPWNTGTFSPSATS